MPGSRLPTGEQSAIVTEVGATPRSYRVAGVEPPYTLEEDGMSDACQGQALLPFPNRTDGGPYEFDGVVRQLPLNHPAGGNTVTA